MLETILLAAGSFIAGVGITALLAWHIHKRKMLKAGREMLQLLEASKIRR
jgi:hypothetical protein